ncbi:MAG TPA: DinB family protein [Acidimicrobiales bacterium]|nr:DinB family protein [Acidimicrobiales bacterium]
MTDERTIDWTHELIEQLDFHWRQLRPRLDGLSDDEYLWEPAPGAWSLRPRAEATTAMAAGAGDWVADFEVPEPTPPPVTTIAWRLGHISVGILGMRASNHFGDGSVSYQTTDWPPTAAGGLALLDEAYDAWLSGIRKLGPGDLARPCGPAEGPYADYSFAALILHINREAIHHGAEVALLRDLWAARSGEARR